MGVSPDLGCQISPDSTNFPERHLRCLPLLNREGILWGVSSGCQTTFFANFFWQNGLGNNKLQGIWKVDCGSNDLSPPGHQTYCLISFPSPTKSFQCSTCCEKPLLNVCIFIAHWANVNINLYCHCIQFIVDEDKQSIQLLELYNTDKLFKGHTEGLENILGKTCFYFRSLFLF